MSFNHNISHWPERDGFKGVTEAAEEAARLSNLHFGSNGFEAIDFQMEDNGQVNKAVGHRRVLLDPDTQVMGVGYVERRGEYRAVQALWVHDGVSKFRKGDRPTREPFVAWPPAGYVPYPIVYPRWSFCWIMPILAMPK